MHGFYFQYFTPSILPNVIDVDINIPPSVNDYQLTFDLPKFDARWVVETTARSLLYSPGNDAEMGCWQEWFDRQLEAIRLTPMLYQQLKEHSIVGKIRLSLMQSPTKVFQSFVCGYAANDFHLEISNKERNLCAEGKIDWKLLYPEIKDLFNQNNPMLYDFYKISRAKAIQSRNFKIKSLLWAFVEHTEENLIRKSELPDEIKEGLLNDLRGIDRKQQRKKYNAKRPAICLSDIESAQVLYFFILKFTGNPRKNQIFGEIALYIWICQHAAFSNLNIRVEDVLSITVTDIDLHALTIIINGEEANITWGFAEVLAAWVGPNFIHFYDLNFSTWLVTACQYWQ